MLGYILTVMVLFATATAIAPQAAITPAPKANRPRKDRNIVVATEFFREFIPVAPFEITRTVIKTYTMSASISDTESEVDIPTGVEQPPTSTQSVAVTGLAARESSMAKALDVCMARVSSSAPTPISNSASMSSISIISSSAPIPTATSALMNISPPGELGSSAIGACVAKLWSLSPAGNASFVPPVNPPVPQGSDSPAAVTNTAPVSLATQVANASSADVDNSTALAINFCMVKLRPVHVGANGTGAPIKEPPPSAPIANAIGLCIAKLWSIAPPTNITGAFANDPSSVQPMAGALGVCVAKLASAINDKPLAALNGASSEAHKPWITFNGTSNRTSMATFNGSSLVALAANEIGGCIVNSSSTARSVNAITMPVNETLALEKFTNSTKACIARPLHIVRWANATDITLERPSDVVHTAVAIRDCIGPILSIAALTNSPTFDASPILEESLAEKAAPQTLPVTSTPSTGAPQSGSKRIGQDGAKSSHSK